MNNLKAKRKSVTLSEQHVIEYAVSKDLEESDYERIYRMDSLNRELFEDIYSSVLDSVFKKDRAKRKRQSPCGTENIWTLCSAMCKNFSGSKSGEWLAAEFRVSTATSWISASR